MRRWKSVEGCGYARDILLSAVKKVEGIGVQGAVGVELEIGLGVSEHGRGIVLPFVNPGEKDVCVRFVGVELEGFHGAAFRIGDATERKLHESDTIVADAGSGRDEETSPNQRFGLVEVRALVKDHGKSEERR